MVLFGLMSIHLHQWIYTCRRTKCCKTCTFFYLDIVMQLFAHLFMSGTKLMRTETETDEFRDPHLIRFLHLVPHLIKNLLLDVLLQKVNETPDKNSHTLCHCITKSLQFKLFSFYGDLCGSPDPTMRTEIVKTSSPSGALCCLMCSPPAFHSLSCSVEAVSLALT